MVFFCSWTIYDSMLLSPHITHYLLHSILDVYQLVLTDMYFLMGGGICWVLRRFFNYQNKQMQKAYWTVWTRSQIFEHQNLPGILRTEKKRCKLEYVFNPRYSHFIWLGPSNSLVSKSSPICHELHLESWSFQSCPGSDLEPAAALSVTLSARSQAQWWLCRCPLNALSQNLIGGMSVTFYEHL